MTVAEAAEAFLARPMPATTRRSYAQTMRRLGQAHGDLPLPALDGATLETFTSAACRRRDNRRTRRLGRHNQHHSRQRSGHEASHGRTVAADR